MENELRTIRNLLSIFLAITVCYLMMVLSSLLVPLALALFLAILLQPLLAWFEAREYRFSVSLALIFGASFLVLAGIGAIIYNTTESLLGEKDTLIAQIDGKLSGLSGMIGELTGMKLRPDQIMGGLKTLLIDWLKSSTGALASMLGDFTSLVFMTLLYLLAFIGGILRYEHYLHYLRGNQGAPEAEELEAHSGLFDGFEEIKQSIVTYMRIKVLVSFFTGGLTWLLCTLFGIQFAIFWGFLAFGLNFIPTIGSIVALVPPLLLSLVQLNSVGAMIAFAVLLLAAQNIIGNVVEPKMMGSSLSLNTATVIMGLVFWGKIWGLTGMFLSVPLLVLTKVILAQIPDAAVLVRLMGIEQVEDLSPPTDPIAQAPAE